MLLKHAETYFYPGTHTLPFFPAAMPTALAQSCWRGTSLAFASTSVRFSKQNNSIQWILCRDRCHAKGGNIMATTATESIDIMGIDRRQISATHGYALIGARSSCHPSHVRMAAGPTCRGSGRSLHLGREAEIGQTDWVVMLAFTTPSPGSINKPATMARIPSISTEIYIQTVGLSRICLHWCNRISFGLLAEAKLLPTLRPHRAEGANPVMSHFGLNVLAVGLRPGIHPATRLGF